MNGINSLREKANARRANIAALHTRVDEIVKEMALLTAQADAYDDAVQIMLASQVDTSESPHNAKPASATTDAHPSKADEQEADKRRGPKGPWRRTLIAVRQHHPKDFGMDDVAAIGASVGHEMNRNTLRSQMSSYAKVGWLERVREGRYRFSPQGLEIVSEMQSTASQDGSGRDAPAADDVYAAGGSPGGYQTDLKASADHTNSPGESDPG